MVGIRVLNKLLLLQVGGRGGEGVDKLFFIEQINHIYINFHRCIIISAGHRSSKVDAERLTFDYF